MRVGSSTAGGEGWRNEPAMAAKSVCSRLPTDIPLWHHSRRRQRNSTCSAPSTSTIRNVCSWPLLITSSIEIKLGAAVDERRV